MTGTVRIGILGAARIAPRAVVRPSRHVARAAVVAVAARDPQRAAAFARKHDVARVHPTYEALLADPEVDAVYNPLPNALHGRWTTAALEAGKHVLVEKPFTANAEEAEAVAAVAAAHPGLVVMEAFHWRYHPLAEELRSFVAGGGLGAVRRVDTALVVPYLKPGDIRFRWDLAGGALMDIGCYAVHALRTFAGAEPEVVGARAWRARDPRVDRALVAQVTLPGGAAGSFAASLTSARLRLRVRVTGERGELRWWNPLAPHAAHVVTTRVDGVRRRRRGFGGESTYRHQLRAFVGAVLDGPDGGPNRTPPADSVATMRVVDAAYTAAGLPRRRPSG